MLRDLLEGGSIAEIVATFVALALIGASFLSVIYIIVGGFSFILSAGNEEKIKKAVHTIRFAIIGLVVAFLAFFLVQLVAFFLGIPFDLSFSRIVDIMQEIIGFFQ